MPGKLAYPYYVPPTGCPPYPYVAWSSYSTPPPPPPPQWIVLPTPVPTDNGVHPVLTATSAGIPYNVEFRPRDAIPMAAYQAVGTHPALPHSASNHIRIVSKVFPWTIDLQCLQAVTCKDVWKAMHLLLQQPISADDWSHIAHNQTLKKAVKRAYERRVRPEERPMSPMRRIDYLGELTLFIGLEKDDAYVNSMLMPSSKKVQQTWVAKFTMS